MTAPSPYADKRPASTTVIVPAVFRFLWNFHRRDCADEHCQRRARRDATLRACAMGDGAPGSCRPEDFSMGNSRDTLRGDFLEAARNTATDTGQGAQFLSDAKDAGLPYVSFTTNRVDDTITWAGGSASVADVVTAGHIGCGDNLSIAPAEANDPGAVIVTIPLNERPNSFSHPPKADYPK